MDGDQPTPKNIFVHSLQDSLLILCLFGFQQQLQVIPDSSTTRPQQNKGSLRDERNVKKTTPARPTPSPKKDAAIFPRITGQLGWHAAAEKRSE